MLVVSLPAEKVEPDSRGVGGRRCGNSFAASLCGVLSEPDVCVQRSNGLHDYRIASRSQEKTAESSGTLRTALRCVLATRRGYKNSVRRVGKG